MKCPVCNIHPAIVEVKSCRIDETEEYERWLEIDTMECDEDVFIALRDTIDQMRETLAIAKNKKDWDSNHRIFQRTYIYPCRRCQKEQDIHYHSKVIIPQRLVEAGVQKEYLSACLDDCGKWLLEYIDKSLYLYGPAGVGKTYAVIALLRHDIANNKVATFITISHLLQKIRASFSTNNDGQTEQQLMTYYSTIPNLYLDDLSSERPTDWMVSTLCSIIDARYNNQLRTVITANIDISDLPSIFGDRIVSRIAGLCGQPVKLNGKDRRLKDI